MASLEDLLSQSTPRTQSEPLPPSEVPVKFITGPAGTGKTFQERKQVDEDPKYGILTATTGIAAINLGAQTLNSVLKFFKTEDLRDRFSSGKLTSTLHKIGRKTRNLVIDEVSMMDARQLDYIFKSLGKVNSFADMKHKMGIVLTGDFAQLPPINAPWVFTAECWPYFEENTEKLSKIWRQDNPEFLEALNSARAGKGKQCVEILQGLKVKFSPTQISKFPGTTILSKNDQVDAFNYAALLDVPGQSYGLKRMTWGEDSSEWKLIPEILQLKDGAYVMILANDISGEFAFANGDCGTVQSKDEDGTIWVRLARNEKLVAIRPITRYKTGRGDALEEKLGLDAFNEDTTHLFCSQEDCGHNPFYRVGPWAKPSYNCNNGSWNIGAVKYYPLRLAYATTVHKSQGLTLDRCQIDCRNPFFGSPSMAYVALSRCRTPEGLTIIGSPEKLASRVVVDPRVLRWI